MSRYLLIGDVHGCFYTLEKLLDKVGYSASDRLVMMGDLVGKGKHSLQVLQWMMSHSVQVVLGNHDLYLLGLLWDVDHKPIHGFDVGQLPQKSKKQIREWLMHQVFCYEVEDVLAVHASISHHWDLEETRYWSLILEKQMQSDPKAFCAQLKNCPRNWLELRSDEEKRAAALQIFTRLRYYRGEDFAISATGIPEDHPDLEPWYHKAHRVEKTICFGHWAALKGQEISDKYIHLDGGAVYHGRLIAYDPVLRKKYDHHMESLDAS